MQEGRKVDPGGKFHVKVARIPGVRTPVKIHQPIQSTSVHCIYVHYTPNMRIIRNMAKGRENQSEPTVIGVGSVRNEAKVVEELGRSR